MEKSRYSTVIVIGNGFDLDFGFKTKYSDYAKSNIWKEMYKERSQHTKNDSLIHYLNEKKDIDKWLDLEASLLEYVSIRSDGTFVTNVDEDNEDYKLVCKNLMKYLDEELKEYQGKYFYSSAAGKLLHCASTADYVNECKIYSFNYTPINFYASVLDWPVGKVNFDFIHGNIHDKNIILGFETDDLNLIASGYSFMIKSNSPQYKSTNIVYDLVNSRDAIFFGHSMNMIDAGYFRQFFLDRSNNDRKECTITFITYNDCSRIEILDNLRKMGVSINSLYTHTHVEFILTSILSGKESFDSKRFEDLLRRSFHFV